MTRHLATALLADMEMDAPDRGGDADRAFLRAMIPHHEAAIEMARRVIERGRDPAVRALAEGIVEAQAAEIDRMRAMLAGERTPRQALMAALPLPAAAEGGRVPEWIHLLPAGEVRTRDGRGPYRYDPRALLAASLAEPEGLLIDQDHATDLAAPQGRGAPARGWITGMEARDDGIWARVDWTAAGRALLADRAYRGVSPVIRYDEASGRIDAILRASLVNRPNLRGIAALHAEGQDMEALVAKLKEMLGLAPEAEESEIWNALSAVLSAATAERAREASAAALQSALAEVGAALGVEGGDQAAILAAAKLSRAGAGDVVALQSQLTALRGELDALQGERARAASEAYVDAEMAKGRVGLNATTRADLVALHAAQPETARRLIEAMPVVGPGAAAPNRQKPPAADGAVALNAEQIHAAKLLGIAPEAYAKALAAEQKDAA